MPDAEGLLRKSILTSRILGVMMDRSLSPEQVAGTLGILVEDLHDLIRGRWLRVSTEEQLIGYLEALGETVRPFEPTLADIRAQGEPIVCVKPTEADLAVYESQHFGASLGIHPAFSRPYVRRLRTKAELGEGKPDA